MAFCRVVFPLLVLSIVSSSASFVPVYVWGDIAKKSVLSDPFKQYSPLEFRGLLKEQLSDNILTVFIIEETLSVEDFSSKTGDEDTAFPYLHAQIDDAIYLPSVRNTLKAIGQLVEPLEPDYIRVTEEGLSKEISPISSDKGKFVFIKFEDAHEGESRVDMLQRHDTIIKDLYSKMKEEFSKVVAVYTAEYPSFTIPETHSRSRRAAESRAMTYKLDGLRLYAKSIDLKSGNSSTPLTVLTATNTMYNETFMNTTMTFDNTTLILNFNQKGGYWFFDSVTLNQASLTEDLKPNEEVFAVLGFSYRCQQYVSFSTVNESLSYTLSFSDIKIQPFFQTTNETQEFGDSFNCVGFFTAPIWAGLFVVFILLLITFYGIMMMLDIRTMDRFDDPKGKTIFINSE